MKVFKNAWFGRFARRERISADALWDAVLRAESGQIVGEWCHQTTDCPPWGRQVQGLPQHCSFPQGGALFFVYGFPKSDLGNIREGEEVQFKKMARHVLSLTDAQLSELLAGGQFEEVVKDDQEIS